MSLSAKVGSLTTPTTTGNRSYTGVGFQPTFLFFVSGLTTTTGSSTSVRFCVGWTAGVGKDVALYMFGVDNQANPDCGRAHRQDFCIYRCSTSLGTSDQASLVSFDADGFTLNWGAINATSTTVAYLALGGDAAAFAGAGPTIPTSGSSVATTGVGFEPVALLLAHSHFGITPSANVDDGFLGLGAASGASAMASISMKSLDNGNGDAAAGDSLDTDSVFQTVGASAASSEAALSSFDADGFTLSVSSNPASTVATSFAALRGLQAKAGSFAKPTATGTQAVTGTGFQPKAGIFWSHRAAAGYADDTTTVVGVSDGTNEFAIGYGDVNGAVLTDTNRRWSTNKGVMVISRTAGLAGEADVQSWDSDGFTLNWTTADANAGSVGYIVFGDPAAAPPSAFTPKVVVF